MESCFSKLCLPSPVTSLQILSVHHVWAISDCYSGAKQEVQHLEQTPAVPHTSHLRIIEIQASVVEPRSGHADQQAVLTR